MKSSKFWNFSIWLLFVNIFFLYTDPQFWNFIWHFGRKFIVNILCILIEMFCNFEIYCLFNFVHQKFVVRKRWCKIKFWTCEKLQRQKNRCYPRRTFAYLQCCRDLTMLHFSAPEFNSKYSAQNFWIMLNFYAEKIVAAILQWCSTIFWF